MPAYGNFVLEKGYDAEAALVKFRAVKGGTTAEGVVQCSVAGEAGRGIAQFDVLAADLTRGKGASIREEGISEWEAGAAIAKDALVTVDAAGRCVTAATGNAIWGRARQAASGAGVRIAVHIMAVKHVHP